MWLTLTGLSPAHAVDAEPITESSKADNKQVASALSAFHSIVFGHNLTPTTYTLSKGVLTLGNYILGYGVTDKLTIATSPWLYADYNMYSAVVRTRGEIGSHTHASERLDWAFQAMYLKTGKVGKSNYQMTAVNSSFVVKHDFESFYSLNLALNYMYFFDETAPYSLRREPYNNDAYQWSISSLQEIRLPGNFGFMAEAGMLGLNYKYPEIHIGLSMYHRSKYSLIQLGFSQTYTSGTLSRMFVTDQSETIAVVGPGRDFSMHPEIQIQLFY